MIKYFIILILTCIITLANAQILKNINPDPKGDPWLVGGYRALSAEELNKIPFLVLPDNNKRSVLPSKVNNGGSNKYFRPIFMQQGGSCSQASGVGYVYTYELNFLRGLSSKDSANQYPPGYTYNFLNGGNGNNGSNYTDGWQIIKENGCPNLIDYGGIYALGDTGWMSGYNKYYNGMSNRLVDYYKIDVSTPEGLNTLKRWLYDHGNGSVVGGISSFSAGIAHAALERIKFSYEKNKWIVTYWSDPVDHSMTFVGYDDSVRVDINKDGRYTNNIDVNSDGKVDMRDWEIGALVFANSWGSDWKDSGYAYLPYRNLALSVSEGGISDGLVYVIDPKPVNKTNMTLKVNLSYNKRNKISIRAGIAEYIKSTVPDYEITYTAFNNQGGSYPMQGAKDSIEIGLDISPLLQQTAYEPVKFFLQIIRSDDDTSATGVINSWSLQDYRTGFKEYFSNDSDFKIINNGTTSSAIILSYPGAPPENLSASDILNGIILRWNRPSVITGLIRYEIFKNGRFYKDCNDTTYTDNFVPNGTTYKVIAVFNSGNSSPSNTVLISNGFHLPVAGSGYSLKYNGIDNCVNCGNGINIANSNFTIEFWAKRNPDPSNEFIMGQSWNNTDHALHIGFRGNQLMCGFWGDDVYTDETYTDSAWHHWAITYDTTTKAQTIYRDGIRAGKRTANANYQGSGNLYIGCMNGNTWFYNGEIDEVRVWNYVRSIIQIDSFIYYPLRGNESGLLGYWRFDERSGDTLFDHSVYQNNGALHNFPIACWDTSGAWAVRTISNTYDTLLVFAGYSKYGHSVSFEIVKPPHYGMVLTDTGRVQFLYKPYQEFYKNDTLIYSVKDDTLVSRYQVIFMPAFPLSSNSGIQSNEIHIYPNPVNDNLKIILNNPGINNFDADIFDNLGRLMLSKHYGNFSNGNGSFDIDVSKLTEGYYSLSIKSANINQSIKFFKITK